MSNSKTYAFDKEADRIIKKYLKVIGGVKNWKKITSIRIIKNADYSRDIWYNITYIYGKGMRVEEHAFNASTPSIVCVNQEGGWKAQNSFLSLSKEDVLKLMGVKEQISTMSSNEYQKMKTLSLLPWIFIDYEQHGITATYKGSIKTDLGDFNEIELKDKDDLIISCFFSVRDNYLSKLTYEKKSHHYSDFLRVGKVLIPHEETVQYLDMRDKYTNFPLTNRYTITQILFNEKQDANFLDKPLN